MRMRLITAIVFLFIALSNSKIYAQEVDSWSLQKAVNYAIEHNLTIQQNVLNQRLAKLTLQQSQLGQLPNVNLSTGYGRSFGRSVDPTTNQFVDGSSYDFMSINGSADVLLFGWFQRRNRIQQNKYNLKAAEEDLRQIKNDISLNVATGYLRALLAQEQVKINQQQVDLSEAQLKQTQEFANAGTVPELNVAQLEAQLASDSSALITSITEYNAAILDIKALLNLDFSVPFEVMTPEVSIEDQVLIADITPEEIYAAASKNLGTIYSSEYKLEAARKGYNAAKGALFPQLSLSAQAGTNYSTLNQGFNITGTEISPVQGSFVIDSTAGNIYQLYQTSPQFTTFTTPLGQQLDNNFRQTISVGLNIPIFNGWQAQFSVRQAKINMLSQDLNMRQAELTLKQDVYKAYNDARNSIQKYYAALRAESSAKRAYDFARKRNELGLTNTVEYLVTQNNWSRAAGNLASAKYDLIFKLKVIDYYLGKELKL